MPKEFMVNNIYMLHKIYKNLGFNSM